MVHFSINTGALMISNNVFLTSHMVPTYCATRCRQEAPPSPNFFSYEFPRNYVLYIEPGTCTPFNLLPLPHGLPNEPCKNHTWTPTGTIQEHYRNITRTSQESYRNLAGTLQEPYRNFTGTLREPYGNLTGTL